MAILVHQRIDHIHHLIQDLLHDRLTKLVLFDRFQLRQQLFGLKLLHGQALAVTKSRRVACLSILKAQLKIGQDASHGLGRLVGIPRLHKIDRKKILHNLRISDPKLLLQRFAQILLIRNRIDRMPQTIQRLI